MFPYDPRSDGSEATEGYRGLEGMAIKQKLMPDDAAPEEKADGH